jgi:hypothetical protein
LEGVLPELMVVSFPECVKMNDVLEPAAFAQVRCEAKYE